LENVTALLLANSAVENVTVDTFMDSQQEVNNPMVIIFNHAKQELIKTFHIAAGTFEELTEMYKLKYFDTTDLPEDTYEKICGAYFVGVGPADIKKERTAATDVLLGKIS
jgi:hypothetical protein